MTPERWQQIKSILAQAMDEAPTSRLAWCRNACGDDESLLAEVLRLLEASNDTADFIEDGALGRGFKMPDQSEDPNPTQVHNRVSGARIGSCRLVRELGAGGMGRVYEAIQDTPRRRVAVKVMRHGLAQRSALRRFEYEAQVLARLKHPNIAQIYEAGTHDDGDGGAPYFVMEYVPNARDLLAYARDRKLDVRARIELFCQVCDAVDHGHRKGIIHRDLKPANLLVDADGTVKVIDFGVARATDADIAVTTLQTDVGQIVGTLQYMSPEQCDADPHELDIRSDVYALGIVLFELLTEELPYRVESKSIYQATKVVREATPRPLSSVSPGFRGDLDTIVRTAMQKDRERRYASADAMRRDLCSYLSGDLIAARPPSMAYQLRVFARKNKLIVGAFAAVMMALILGIAGMSFGLIRAHRNLERALSAEAAAEVEAERARAISDFLARTMASANPFLPSRSARLSGGTAALAYAGEAGRQLTVIDMLRHIDASLQDTFAESPDVEAQLRHTLGETFLSLGLLAEAAAALDRSIELNRASHGSDDPRVARSLVLLAATRDQQGDATVADERYAEAVALLERSLGATHEETIAASAERAFALLHRGRLTDAIALQRSTLDAAVAERGDRDPVVLDQMVRLCETLWIASSFDEAVAIGDRAVMTLRLVAGDDAYATAYARYVQSGPLRNVGRHDDARLMAEAALSRFRIDLGVEHPLTLDCMRNLGNIHTELSDYARAHELYREALAAQRRLLPPTHVELLMTLNDYAASLAMEGEALERAEVLVREAHSGFAAVLGPETQLTLNAADTLAMILRADGRPEEAIAQYEMILEAADRRGLQHSLRILAHVGMAESLTDLARYAEAEPHLEQAADLAAPDRDAGTLRAWRIADAYVSLFEASGNVERASEWQQILAAPEPRLED